MGEWRWLYRLRLRLKTLLQRERVEQELDEELRYHLECRAEQEMARGATAEEALRTAVRAMEGIARTKEECRDARGLHLVESLAQDVRYALRMMARSAGASTLSVLTLALGIGASLTILIVLVPVLLRPLPFPDAGRLVAVFATKPDGARDSTSFRDFEDWQTESHSFTGLAAYRPDPFGITGGGAPEPVPGLRASYEIFHVLGVSPAMGRVFDQREQAMNARVALISHRLWVRRFGAAAGVPGKTIFLDEVGYSIIGVLPKRFPFPSFRDPDVIVPITESPDRARGYLFAAGRLRAGVSIGAAQHELDAVAMRLGQTFPDTNRRRGVRVVPLQEAAAGAVRTPLLVLMGAAVFVLLIGCANVGNLVLARSIARRREFALRSALGATAGRLLRQLLAEGAVIGMLAALAGWTLAAVGSEWLAAALSQQFALPAVRLDGSMLVTGALAALLCGVLGGLPAALMVWRSRPGDALQEGGRRLAGG
ncbi:MAG TPA: ABC transporter permease, partial [Bryobacteraceae bacterium]|nr:ABC transporter permease [Bryobacteraceae bacterium]